MLKTIIGKLERKKDNDVNANVTQLERSNNKCYPSTFQNFFFFRDNYNMLLTPQHVVILKNRYENLCANKLINRDDSEILL